MTDVHVKAGHRSAWFVVVLPTIEFLVILFGMPVLFHHVGLQGTSYVLLGLVAGFVAAILVCVKTYGILLKMASRGSGELRLDGNGLKWQVNGKWKSLDLNGMHFAKIGVGGGYSDDSTGAGFSLGGDGGSEGIGIHVRGVEPEDVLRLFPHPYFVDEFAIKPEEGAHGFDLAIQDEGVKTFLETLLAMLWKTRNSNKSFLAYRKFPWESMPDPEVVHIRKLAFRDGPTSNREYIRSLQQRVLSSPVPELAVTGDYLLGYQDDAPESLLDPTASNHEPAHFFVMPLGHVFMERNLPTFSHRWKVAEMHSVTVKGLDESGEQISVDVPWIGPSLGASTEALDEAAAFIKFVNLWVRSDDTETGVTSASVPRSCLPGPSGHRQRP